VASNLDAKLAVLGVLTCNEHSKLLTYASEPNSKYLKTNIGKKRGYDASDAFPPIRTCRQVCANLRCQNQMKKYRRGLNLKSASSTFPHFISFHLALNFIDITFGHGLYPPFPSTVNYLQPQAIGIWRENFLFEGLKSLPVYPLIEIP
jgi:hypothetical protein